MKDYLDCGNTSDNNGIFLLLLLFLFMGSDGFGDNGLMLIVLLLLFGGMM